MNRRSGRLRRDWMTMAGLAACEPTTRGVHHLALCTDDMKATIEFYTDIVGMPLVHAMKVPEGLGTGPNNRGNPPYESVRHYFFDMGNDSLLAFFEIPRDAEPPCNRNAIGAMQHCRSEEHTSELQSLMRISYAVFCLKKKQIR